jgi:hypothetical protein
MKTPAPDWASGRAGVKLGSGDVLMDVDPSFCDRLDGSPSRIARWRPYADPFTLQRAFS